MNPPPPRAWWVRLLLSVAAGGALGVVVAIALTVVDLYLSGHGRPPLSAPFIDWPGLGVHLSLPDLVFLVSVVVGAIVTWRYMEEEP